MERESYSSRVEVGEIMSKLRNKLGDNWDKYRHSITHFLTGKSSFYIFIT